MWRIKQEAIMSIETGVVIDLDGKPIFWHLPAGRTAISIPDTRLLWDVLWERRDEVAGFAHSHPGSGTPQPSETDVTTFFAIEQGLGRRLQWWITSADTLVSCMRYGGNAPRYSSIVMSREPAWVEMLRQFSDPYARVPYSPTRRFS
jgi:hypothetical protein